MIKPVLTWRTQLLTGVILGSLMLPDGFSAERDNQQSDDTMQLEYSSAFDLSDAPAVNSDTTEKAGGATRSTTAEPSTLSFDSSREASPSPKHAWDMTPPSDVSQSVEAQQSAAQSEPMLSAAQPTLGYSSAFDTYDRFEESPDPDWVGANERVGKIGGWQAYARQMYEANKAREAAKDTAKDMAPTEIDP